MADPVEPPVSNEDLAAWASRVISMRVDDFLFSEICCTVCGKGDREDVLLLCDNCQTGCHIYCLDPPLDKVPEHNWSCGACMDYDDIDSSSGVDEDEEVVAEAAAQVARPASRSAPVARLANDSNLPSLCLAPFVRVGTESCAVCRVSPSTMFVLDAAVCALSEAPTLPVVQGTYACDECSTPLLELAAKAQTEALNRIEVRAIS